MFSDKGLKDADIGIPPCFDSCFRFYGSSGPFISSAGQVLTRYRFVLRQLTPAFHGEPCTGSPPLQQPRGQLPSPNSCHLGPSYRIYSTSPAPVQRLVIVGNNVLSSSTNNARPHSADRAPSAQTRTAPRLKVILDRPLGFLKMSFRTAPRTALSGRSLSSICGAVRVLSRLAQ